MDETQLHAGVAREIISPSQGIYLIGYADHTKGNTGVHDDLTATALVLDNGRQRLALVACDLLCLNEYIVDRVRAEVGRQAQVMICCSHTHAGPIAYADHNSSRRRRATMDTLVELIARAVSRAEAALAPARLAWGLTEADIAVNRRERQPDGEIAIGVNPAGPIDRSVGILGVQATDGTPLATVVNYACHGTVLGPDNLLVSADWVGAMRPQVEEAVDGLVLFLQGAAGDLNPDYQWGTGDPWEAVQSLGERVAGSVIAACNGGLSPLAGAPLGLSRQTVWLPLEAKATTATPLPTYRRVLTKMVGLPYAARFAVDLLLERRYPWRSRIEAQDGFWHVPMRVNTVRIGELGLVTFAAETLTEIGLAIKASSPAEQTLFASVSDGCVGYLPTAEAHAEGGYEVDVAPYAYRYPSRLASNCARIAIDAATQALRELW
jgi:neutral ceramidase